MVMIGDRHLLLSRYRRHALKEVDNLLHLPVTIMIYHALEVEVLLHCVHKIQLEDTLDTHYQQIYNCY